MTTTTKTSLTANDPKDDGCVRKMFEDAVWAYAEMEIEFSRNRRSSYYYKMSGVFEGTMSCLEMFVSESSSEIKNIVANCARNEYGVE